jgi:K(+)-stimulated pyrophosphate-energized sodium pump
MQLDLTSFPLYIALVSLLYAAVQIAMLLRQNPGSKRMQEIANAVKIGATAFLIKEYLVILPAGVILAIAIYLLVGPIPALGFVTGALFSALAGFIGMSITVRSSSRVAQIASKGLGHALSLAFRGGSVMGFSVAGFALLGLSLFVLLFGNDIVTSPALIAGLGFGASLIAMFMRVGGGIYTKAADLGADLVGKVEVGIPEDDPRNPAVIADNVGDNVGDCAGMGSDVYESYIVIGIASIILAALLLQPTSDFPFKDFSLIYLPLLIGAFGIIGSIIGSLFVNPKLGNRLPPMRVLDIAFIISSIIVIILTYVISYSIMPSNIAQSITIATITGVVLVVVIEKIVDYYTSYNYNPTKSIAEASKISAATNFLQGYSVGLKSTAPSALALVIAVLISYLSGYYATNNSLFAVYNTAIATMAMLSLTAIVMSIDSYGPITDNANGIVEMSGLGEDVRLVTEKLDAVGNTVKATTKGFAIASAALSALALFQAFQTEVAIKAQTIPKYIQAYGSSSIQFVLSDPKVIIGLLVGGLLPFFFSSFLISAVGRTAMKVVLEVRRQFKEIPGLLEGKASPDYSKCIGITTQESLKELALPGLLAVLTPIVLGLILGPLALGGLLIGSVVSGVFLALLMANGGAAWDNAKKFIELGNFGGKGSDAHKVAVVGDTVGDPFKDTAGPSLNSLIKVLNTISIVFLSTIMTYAILV